MAQTRFLSYRAPVNSFPLNEQNTGILKPGRYNGFNEMTEDAGLNIKLGHLPKVRKTGPSNQPQDRFGKLVMPTGIIIQEDAPIALTVETNAGNTNKRVDLVICEHTYQEVQGGNEAIYSIVKGPMDGSTPTLVNPAKQVIIGEIHIEPNGFTFDELTWKVSIAPLLGDLSFTELAQLINSGVVIEDATESEKGILRLATQQEVYDGNNDTKAVTPRKLKNLTATESRVGLVAKATDQDVEQGVNDRKYVTPKQLKAHSGKTETIKKSSSFTLDNSMHGKVIEVESANLSSFVITIPAGLRQGFEVAVYQVHEYEPSTNGFEQMPEFGRQQLVEFEATDCKAIATAGNKLHGPGSMCLVKQIGNDYYQLMGELEW